MNWTPLLRWFAREGRDLPWRKTHDPYRVLVSEIMLQQTQVSRVLLYYRSWLKRFPTWRALARASNAEVIHAWAGLGYNRRGLMLRDIAKRVVSEGMPMSYDAWLSFKGIGPYTAAAVASFAQGLPTVPIDTNIRRVLGRALLGKLFPTPLDDPRIRKQATHYSLLPTHFQALFDLAVAVCKKSPACSVCPMKSQCTSAPKFLSGRIRIPRSTIKKTHETRHRDKPFPDRIYRGRILALVRQNPISLSKLGPLVDVRFEAKRDAGWIRNMVKRMEKDGLVRIASGRVRLG